MNEKEHINSSEKLLHTNLMELMGGKGMPDLQEFVPPPEIPPIKKGDDGSGGGKLPELVNSNVDEVLNRPPSWLISWGTTVFFLVFLGLIAITWFVEYPDLVSAPIRVISNDIPKPILTKSEGLLNELFVSDGEAVLSGQRIAFIESTADHNEVLALNLKVEKLIQKLESSEKISLEDFRMESYYKLGELQAAFQNYQSAQAKAMNAASGGIYNKKINTIYAEVNTLKKLYGNAEQQLEIQAKDLELALQEYQSQERLSEKGFASKLDAKNAYSKYLSKKQAYEQAKGALDNNVLNQTQRRQDVVEIEKNVIDEKQNIVQTLNSLKSEIEKWKQKYVVLASSSGKAVFSGPLQANMVVKNGQELLSILPAESGFFGEMHLGQYNLGKVKLGQEVIVKFNAYPFAEFGTVRAKIGAISDVPKDSTYLVKINFPNALNTTLKKELPFRYGMTAQGDIVTENLRLIEKFFYDIRKSLKR